MYIGSCYEGEIEGRFIYSPFDDMLGAMHVLCNEVHHLGRIQWAEKIKSTLDPEFLYQIKKLGQKTNDWCIVMDFRFLMPEELVGNDTKRLISKIETLSLFKWNKIFKLYEKRITEEEKKEIIEVLTRMWEEYFNSEIKWLQPFVLHRMKKELERCKEQGLSHYIDRLHDRIEVGQEWIICHKQKDYRIEKAKLKQLDIAATTFLAPHLMLGVYEERIILMKHIELEEKKEKAPEDLVMLLKALGDDTRLQILKEMKYKAQTTQELAIKLKITEAGISKHLRLLYEAGIVGKERKGNYIYYSLKAETIDFIPYKISEYLM